MINLVDFFLGLCLAANVFILADWAHMKLYGLDPRARRKGHARELGGER